MKRKIVEWIVSIVLVIITAALYNHFSVKRDNKIIIQNDKTAIQKQFELKADKSSLLELKNYSDKQDDNLKGTLKQHIDESRQATMQQTEWIKSVDQKLNILVNKEK